MWQAAQPAKGEDAGPPKPAKGVWQKTPFTPREAGSFPHATQAQDRRRQKTHALPGWPPWPVPFTPSQGVPPARCNWSALLLLFRFEAPAWLSRILQPLCFRTCTPLSWCPLTLSTLTCPDRIDGLMTPGRPCLCHTPEYLHSCLRSCLTCTKLARSPPCSRAAISRPSRVLTWHV